MRGPGIKLFNTIFKRSFKLALLATGEICVSFLRDYYAGYFFIRVSILGVRAGKEKERQTSNIMLVLLGMTNALHTPTAG